MDKTGTPNTLSAVAMLSCFKNFHIKILISHIQEALKVSVCMHVYVQWWNAAW
jgi:hypothetical protein